MTLRADARRNREQILAAARRLLVEHGPDHPLEDIAKAAGVGIGTLYRRFPDRAALVDAVLHDGMDQLVDAAQAALREESDAWSALCRFVRFCVRTRLGGLSAVIDPLRHEQMRLRPETVARRRVLTAALGEMIGAAQQAGDLRTDIGVGDLGMLINVHVRQSAGLADLSERVDARLAELLLAGLRASAQEEFPLPGEPLGAPDIDG
ncbi:TetR/AcrR family transcriptional regulator [Fodinicola acaciae]|uniref:TetR/AcrR family transcriptional regulator n=1 Tax=Fodinicola acaciae TaxID=2681555 RepID=UPI0013D75743|nr:TetR/AcrR family transcriptional regulator [Fodinicola acaciae]